MARVACQALRQARHLRPFVLITTAGYSPHTTTPAMDAACLNRGGDDQDGPLVARSGQFAMMIVLAAVLAMVVASAMVYYICDTGSRLHLLDHPNEQSLQ